MSYSNGIISGNVTIPDLKAALSTTTTDVVQLCRHSNINKYSRYKPYAFGGILPNGLYNGSTNPSPGGVAEKLIRDNNFGMTPTIINFPINNSIANVITAWKQWQPPSGKRKADAPSQAEDEPCRMGDFLGYDANARPYMENYEIFGDIRDDFFYPIRNGMMGVRITINSKTGTSILPSEFNFGSIPFNDMRLTLIIANLDKVGRFLYVQSQRSIEDAAIESFWNTATKKGTLEVRMDLTSAENDDINTFLNGGTNLFMAVGLAEEVDLNSNWDILTDVGNATYINVKSTVRKMPFNLINIDMWNNGWKLAGIYGGFAINANREARFNLPCNLGAYPDYTHCSYNASTKIVSISFGGTKFTIQAFFKYASSAPAPYTASASDISDFRGFGRLGLMFNVEISKSGNVLSETKYIVIAPSRDETGSLTTADDRIITIDSGGIAFDPAFTKGNSEADRTIYKAWYGADYVPTNGVIQIPYDGKQGRVTVKMNCSIICFPYRDVNTHWVYAVPVAQFSNNVVEKLVLNTDVGSN